jgi:hypothetical protein
MSLEIDFAHLRIRRAIAIRVQRIFARVRPAFPWYPKLTLDGSGASGRLQAQAVARGTPAKGFGESRPSGRHSRSYGEPELRQYCNDSLEMTE